MNTKINKKAGTEHMIQDEHLNTPSCYEDEIDLAELLAVLWRNRWLMIAIVAVIVISAGLYCLLNIPRYEIVAQIRPGITGYDQDGKEIRSLTPMAIKTWFSKSGYVNYLSNFPTNNKADHTPRINASIQRNSSIITVSTFYPDRKEGKELLSYLLHSLSKDLEKNLGQDIKINKKRMEERMHSAEIELERIPIKKSNIEGDIRQKRNQISIIEAELGTIAKNKAQMEEAKKRIREQVKNIYKNTNELLNLRKEMIKGGADKFALLMYSNIVQQNITYITNLEQRLANIEKEINEFSVTEAKNKSDLNNIKIDIKKLETKRDKELPLQRQSFENRINVIKAQLESISPIEIVQSPFSSPEPVRPRTKMILTISFVLSCFLAIFAAFLREFWINNKAKLTG